MKSIRQKAKAYDEAIKRAKSKLHYSDKPCFVDITEFFPELKESEDEIVRKKLIHLVKKSHEQGGYALHKWEADEMLAWLEKQGQKPATIDIDKMVNDYANNKERGNEEFGKPVNCMIRAYRQGLNDAIGKVVLAPTWSEEDDLMLLSIIQSLETTNGAAQIKIDWLKAIKQRIG